MQKKLTITVNEEVYAGLHSVIGRRNISQFIESLVRPHVLDKDFEAAYQQMAQDEAREAEALAWIEGTLGEITDETRGSVVGKLRPKRGRRNPKAKTGRHHQQ
jgi:predicted CopG family antitoxin